MQKLWAAFFGVVLGAIFLLCVVSPFVGWWMPQNVSSFGGDVDNLFYIILYITGGAFVLTEVLLVWFMWRYARKEGRKAVFVHGNHRLELFWTIATGAILIYIAFAQVNVWERIKYQGLMPQPDQIVTVTARQWEWRLRYPADVTKTDAEGRAWAEAPEVDDVRIQNELHTWKGAKVRIYLKTQDVIHSFGLPNLRLMQDALPGKTIPMWFSATEANTEWDAINFRCTEPDDPAQRWEIACKELCGGGHYRMRGRLYVHADQADFEHWLHDHGKAQDSHEPEKIPSAGGTPVASAGS
ncbi:MAG TPA: cytochrome c oxidase subunit II [Gemmataceae bacterium]|nr:cytochrome c oxidase subunit II [Gemmataceae bacterium]